MMGTTMMNKNISDKMVEKIAGIIRVHGRISHAHLHEHIRNEVLLKRGVWVLEHQGWIITTKEPTRETLYRRKGSLPNGSIPDRAISRILHIIIDPRKYINRTDLMMRLKMPMEDLDAALDLLKAMRVVVEKKGERKYYSWREE